MRYPNRGRAEEAARMLNEIYRWDGSTYRAVLGVDGFWTVILSVLA